MTDRKKPSIPFYNMHGHTTFSIFDGMGYPEEHVDFAYGNGLEGMAFTEHGNMNSFSYAFQKAKKMKDEGKNDFKVVYGIEAYVHPDIEQWKVDKEKIKEDAKLAKQVDEDIGLVVEDESETKKGIKSVLNQRSHLVLNAINQKGLNNLFKLVSTNGRKSGDISRLYIAVINIEINSVLRPTIAHNPFKFLKEKNAIK